MPERRNLRRDEDAMGVRFQDPMLAKAIELRTGPRGTQPVAPAPCVERLQDPSERHALVRSGNTRSAADGFHKASCRSRRRAGRHALTMDNVIRPGRSQTHCSEAEAVNLDVAAYFE